MLHHNLCIPGPNQPGHDCGGESGIKGQRRMLPENRDCSVLEGMFHYSSNHFGTETAADRALTHVLSLGVTFSLRASKLLWQS